MRGRAFALGVAFCVSGCSLVFDPDAYSFVDGGTVADGGRRDTASGDGGQGDAPQSDGRQSDGVVGDGAPPGPVCVDGGTAVSCREQLSGLIVEYKFADRDAGDGRTVYDSSGFGDALNLTIQDDAAWTWEASALCVEPGGDDSSPRIVSPGWAHKIYDAVLATGEVAVEVWLRPERTDLVKARIVTLSYGGDDLANQSFQLLQNDDEIQYRLAGTPEYESGKNEYGMYVFHPSVELSQHLVFMQQRVGDENRARVFVNGAEQTVSPGAGNPFPNVIGTIEDNWERDRTLGLGGDYSQSSNPRQWQGCLDYVAIYDRALASDDVMRLFQEGDPP